MKLRLAGFIASLCFLMSVAAAPTTAASSPSAQASPASTLSLSDSSSLLDQAFDSSQKLGSKEKIYLLIELCTVSADLKVPAERIKSYSLNLWDLASTEQDRELHIVGQKSAVTYLSYVDPQAALDKLAKIDFQRPTPDQPPLYEDHRYNAAETTFVNLVAQSKSQKTIDSIAATARYLGQTGQYPFVGIDKVIDVLPPSAKPQIDSLLKDAIDSYATETGFYNRDSEFFKLLQSLKNPALDKGLVAQAFTTFARTLKQNPIDIPGDFYAEIRTSNNKVFPFAHRPDVFLFRVYPRLQRLNASYAAQLLQQDPKLKEAADGMTYTPGRYIQGDPTSEEAARLHSQWLQESLLARIKNCQDTKPETAAALAQRLTDPGSRIAGFSAASSGLASKDSSAARAIFQDQLVQLDNLANSTGKLHAMVALVSAAFRTGDLNEYKALSQQAFDLGIGFVTADSNPDVQNRNGFADLQDLVIFTASQPSDILLARVQQFPDEVVRLHLLVSEERGQANQTAPPSAPATCTE